MLSTGEMFTTIAAGVIELVFGLVYATSAIYLGIKVFDRMTPDIDEMEELKKGNAAVAIVLVAVVLAIAGIIQAGFIDFETQLKAGLSPAFLVLLLVLALIRLAWSLLVSLFAVYIALKILDLITVDIDEIKELKKRNIAVAILMAGVLLAISFVIQASVATIIGAPPFDAKEVGAAIGLK